MLNITVQIDDQGGTRHVGVSGELDVHNATEFGNMVGQLADALGPRAAFDLTTLTVQDAAGWAAVRRFLRDTEEFGGPVVVPPPQRVATTPAEPSSS